MLNLFIKFFALGMIYYLGFMIIMALSMLIVNYAIKNYKKSNIIVRHEFDGIHITASVR